MTKEHEPQPIQLTIEQVAKLAAKMTLKNGGHIPTVFVQAEGKNTLVGKLSNFPDTHEARLERMILIGMAYGHDPYLAGSLAQVFFVCEAWMSSATEDEPLHMPPSQDPKRQEVLVVSEFDLTTQQSAMIVYEMMRGDDETLLNLQLLVNLAKGTEVNTAHSPLLEAFVFGFFITAGSSPNLN
jgi:hypothetical protein